MSAHSLHESATSVGNSGPDTSIDLYLSCLWTLKEKIGALLQHHHMLILQKMECDLGNMVTCNTESFRNLVTDVFVQLNEIEIQLSGLEAWAGLPPECFSPTSASSSMPFDADQIFTEAQTLVEVVRQLQLGLHSMVSKPSSQSLSITSASAVSSSGTPSKSSVAASQSRGVPTPVYGGAHVTPSYSATPVVAPCSISSTHVDASPQIQDSGSYANFAYKSPCAVSGSGSIQSQSTSGLYPSPSMHMSTDTFTQPPSAGRQAGSSCPDPNFTISTSNMRADYHSHIQQVLSIMFTRLHTTICSARYATILVPATSKHSISWTKFGIPADRAGTETVYRDVRPEPGEELRVPRRVTSACPVGGGGKPYLEPYLQPKPVNIRYNPHMYQGGLLPRLEHTDEPVRLPEYRPRDYWAPHRAHFGQNDYIDLLGDGKLGPRDFYTGPTWALGARNEFQRVCARLNNPAIVAWLEEFEPSRLKLDQKSYRYLYKKVNKRKNIKFLRYRDAP